jgi:hypothetical protein
MTIVEALKQDDINDLRVSHEDKWLFYEEWNKEWCVYQKMKGHKVARVLYQGKDEEIAVEVLLQ